MVNETTRDTTPLRKDVYVPSLSFVKSNFPIPTKEDAKYFSHTIADKDKDGKRDHTIVALNLSTDHDAFKRIIKSDTSSSKGTTSATISTLNIYCDTFTLTKELHVPEANITIHARVIKGNDT